MVADLEAYDAGPTLLAKELTEIEEPELEQREGGLVKRMALHLPQPADGVTTNRGVALDLIARERLSAILDS